MESKNYYIRLNSAISRRLQIIITNPNSSNFFAAYSLPVACKLRITLIQNFFSFVVTILLIIFTSIGWLIIFEEILKSL